MDTGFTRFKARFSVWWEEKMKKNIRFSKLRTIGHEPAYATRISLILELSWTSLQNFSVDRFDFPSSAIPRKSILLEFNSKIASISLTSLFPRLIH
jgi:hypothetical protein